MVSKKKAIIQNTVYHSIAASILKGKKRRHATDFIRSLAKIGPSTTHEVAKIVLSKQDGYDWKPVRYMDIKKRGGIYYNLIRDRPKNNDEKYSGLISAGYVLKVGERTNHKGHHIPLYFLTLKGCLFSIGCIFNDKETVNFIRNASKNHLFFAYLDTILEKTSLAFIKKIFIEPIKFIITKDLIRLDDEIDYYFTNISEIIGRQVYKEFDKVVRDFAAAEAVIRIENYPSAKNFNILINNTFYDSDTRKHARWIEKMINYFYSNEEEVDFYGMYSRYYEGHMSDVRLLYQIMKSVHHAYYEAYGFGIPVRHRQKIPRSRHNRDN